VLLPNVGTVHARVKVEAVGNVFFDVSNDDFVVLALPTVTSSAPAGPPCNTVTRCRPR
jgi:hypothetical protein